MDAMLVQYIRRGTPSSLRTLQQDALWTGILCGGCVILLQRMNVLDLIQGPGTWKEHAVWSLRGILSRLRQVYKGLFQPNKPPVLKMRQDVPPSFWDPESPLMIGPDVPPSTGSLSEPLVSGMWKDEDLGRGMRWERETRPLTRHPSKQDLKYLMAPHGPDSPGRGRPDWSDMLHGLKSSGGKTGLSQRSTGELSGSRSMEIFPDEISEATEEDIALAKERSRERAHNARSAASVRVLDYQGYLQLDKILKAQEPQSRIYDMEVHDEMLFIIIHQTYELWFKQVLHELDSVLHMFSSLPHKSVKEMDVSLCLSRSSRVVEILKVLVSQFDVLETMHPQAFSDFRDFLSPASGFQSMQFRLVENKLGMRPEQRIQHSGCPYYQHLAREEEREEVLAAEREVGLLDYLGEWLEKLMDEVFNDFDFAAYMKEAIEQAAVHDRSAIERFPTVRTSNRHVESKESALNGLEKKRLAHLKLFDEQIHNELIKKGIRQLSFKATMACVFVQSFSHEAAFQTIQRFLTKLIEIDELIARWRQRHSSLVLRMIGSKDGTGGSSGHAYLNAVMQKSRIFVDLCHCSHYLLPQHSMLPLPAEVKRRLQMSLSRASSHPFMNELVDFRD
mmetsp:Transcript_5712/g.20083  ORF Transcript_5712/g.20083 Transcript_5712/m.20083 type:complete len:617 (-) Transcript_5712:154-2004(-)